MDALLSLDLGTTGCKAAICSPAGEVLGTSYLEYPLETPSPGWVEQDADLWWELAQQAICRALAVSGVAGREILALSVSSQGISFVPVDRDGHVLRRAISWLDMRATAEAAQIRAQVGDVDLFRLTGKRPAPFYVLPKLLWLQRHEPKLCLQTHKYLLAHDLLLHRLCGAMVTDYTLAGGTLLLDLHHLAWSKSLLATFEVNPAQIPDLAWAGTLAGELTGEAAKALGLRRGMPIVVGAQDQKCAALGAGICPGRATISLGTAAAITCVTQGAVLDDRQRVPTFPFVAPGQWVLEGVVGTAGAALKWLRNMLFPTKSYIELDHLAEESLPGAGGVRFYPHLSGATSPWWQDGVQGAFTGLCLATNPGDLVRSVLEGVAFQVRANLDVMAQLCPIEELVLFGGGARSVLWPRIISAVAGKPVRVAAMADMANWGACVLAGVGAGLERDQLGVGLGRRDVMYDPEVSLTACYAELYGEYCATDPATPK